MTSNSISVSVNLNAALDTAESNYLPLQNLCRRGVRGGNQSGGVHGGMGRTINGSYAEYTYPPAANVVPIKTDLLWEEFAVIPDQTQLPGRACIAIWKSKKAKPC
jgi:D-arabinose 1-dehydrogenase-like Zn-dependent alcohol dehydrogenase